MEGHAQDAERTQQEKSTHDHPENSGALREVIAGFDDSEGAEGNEKYGPKAQDGIHVDETHVAEQEHHAYDNKDDASHEMLFRTALVRTPLFPPPSPPFPSVVVHMRPP